MSARAWLDHALCTDPADRHVAEEIITEFYRRLNRPPPTFVWVGSPAAAVRLLPPSSLSGLVSRNAENELASLASATRRTRSTSSPQHRTVESIAGMIRAEVRTTVERLGLHWAGQLDDAVPDLSEQNPWVTLARSCGWWWPRDHLCVLSERMSALHTEPIPDGGGQLRPHSNEGPAIEYSDGWTVHAWHGTRVPSWVIEAPTIDRIGAESNVEVRRCAIERIGWGAFIDRAGLRLVSQAADPGNPGAELLLYDLPYQRWGTPTRLLLAINGSVERDGTRRRYGLRVPPWFDDPLDAAGWTYGLTGIQYARLQRRT
jgi:hypothetical protein